MSTKIAPMPQHQHKTTHHKQKGSEATFLMNDEDPFMDSPASVSIDSALMGTAIDGVGGKEKKKKQIQEKEEKVSFKDENTVSQWLAESSSREDASLQESRPTESMSATTNRGDYTALVRNKYFDNPRTVRNDKISGNNLLEEKSRASSSNMDLSEIFECDGGMSLTPGSTSYQLEQGNSFTPRGDIKHDTDLLSPMKQDSTPPLSLYSEYHGIPTSPNSNPFTTESAGLMSPVAMDGMDVSSGRNTPTSHLHPGAADTLIGSVASSSGSMMASSSLISKRPVLYSAIGSLEQVNNNSLRNLSKRYLAPSKEFCKLGAVQSGILIPPANQGSTLLGQKQKKTSLLATVSDIDPQENDKEQRTTPPVSNTSENHRTEDIQKTAGSNKMTRKLSGQEVFGVLKNNATKEKDGKLIPDIAGELQRKRSNLRSASAVSADATLKAKNKGNKKVSYNANVNTKKKKSKGPIEMFRPSSDAYTPRIERKRIEYKAAEARTPVQQMASPMGTLQRPNFRDALRRVAMIIHQHVVKIENRFEGQSSTKLATDDGLFKASMRDMFNEDVYRTPTYKCTMVRIPMARPGMTYGLRKIRVAYEIPSETEIYEFAHQLFKSVQLSSECSIVCLIYIERLMEAAKVPLLACTWRPIFMCGLLLASKVWQDLSSWNIEFASVYPQFSLDAINRLELNFLRNVKWDLYISSSLYAKYYFALRSLVEKQDFRQRYNRMVGGVDTVAQAEALKVQKRTEQVKEEALLQLSRSM